MKEHQSNHVHATGNIHRYLMNVLKREKLMNVFSAVNHLFIPTTFKYIYLPSHFILVFIYSHELVYSCFIMSEASLL